VQIYRVLAASNIDWGVLAKQIPTLVALCFVCSFGTSMDVIAVQADVPESINVNHEIQAAGVANVATGILAGGGPGVSNPTCKRYKFGPAKGLHKSTLGLLLQRVQTTRHAVQAASSSASRSLHTGAACARACMVSRSVFSSSLLS
jgi:hypothetical protein